MFVHRFATRQHVAGRASYHTTVPLRAVSSSTAQKVNRSVVAVPAFALAIDEAAKRGDTRTMLRLATGFNKARVCDCCDANLCVCLYVLLLTCGECGVTVALRCGWME
jgi:hypothetical protein